MKHSPPTRKINNVNLSKKDFLYYLSPIGPPNYPFKLDLLKRNLNNIHISLGCNFDIAINSYGTAPHQKEKIKNLIKSIDFIDNVFFHFKKGFLTQVFLDNPDNEKFMHYKYILFIMDDVEIKFMPINEAASLLKKYKTDCLSPDVIRSTHKNWFPEGLNIVNRVEIFCLLIQGTSFKKFLNMFKKTNPCFWGVDVMLGFKKFYCLVCSLFIVDHKLRNDSASHRTREKHAQGCKQVRIDSKGKYNNIPQVINDFRLIKEKIYSDKDLVKILLYGKPPPQRKNDLINTINCSNKKWNTLSHEEKYNYAIKQGFKAKNGKPLKEVQPKYDKNKNNFLPDHVEFPTPPPQQRQDVINTINCSNKKWNTLSHEEKYNYAIKQGFKAKNGKYLINFQPKYNPTQQNFLPE
jgi:hypothetical protein